MPRKTAVAHAFAHEIIASMRPRRDASENVYIPKCDAAARAGFNEAEA